MLDSLQNQLTHLRHQLHAHAELSGQEHKTAAIVAKTLKSCQPDQLIQGVGGTGIIAIFEGEQPGDTVLLRVDMDAIPVHEANSNAYCSLNAGVSHVCGHDGHMSVMLGVARMLAKKRPSKGRVCLLFQPAEETGTGAAAVLADPAFNDIKPEAVFALHNLPGFEQGEVVVRNGSFSASVQSMVITLNGLSCHAAEPENGISPALAVSELLQLAYLLSNNKTEQHDFQLVTPIHVTMGEKAYGTSASQAEVHFTLRCWTQAQMKKLEVQLLNYLSQLKQRYGLEVRYQWIEAFQASENDSRAVALIEQVARQQKMPVNHCVQPFKWGEDFGLFTQKFPGALFGIGAGKEHAALHNADYDFPDALLAPAAKLFYQLAIAALQKSKSAHCTQEEGTAA